MCCLRSTPTAPAVSRRREGSRSAQLPPALRTSLALFRRNFARVLLGPRRSAEMSVLEALLLAGTHEASWWPCTAESWMRTFSWKRPTGRICHVNGTSGGRRQTQAGCWEANAGIARLAAVVVAADHGRRVGDRRSDRSALRLHLGLLDLTAVRLRRDLARRRR